MAHGSPTSAPSAAPETQYPGTDHWLTSDPVRTGFLLVVAVSLAVRFNILRDSYFITDDFMLSSRAAESPFGWDYLFRVHTGHLEPIGFAVMWGLAHVAPWNWGAALTVLLLGQAVVAVLVWRLLVELFGRRPLTLVPFALYCLTPLTAPATTWLSAAIIWVPLMAAVAGGTRQHVRYVRTGRARHALAAVLWLVVGFASFEKTLVVLPYLVALTVAVSPQARAGARGLLALVRRTWLVWAAYAVATIGYLALYLRSSSAGGADRLFAPSVTELWDFTYLSLFRTFIPGALGGPWSWQPAGYAGALVDSPRLFDWVCWIAASLIVCASLALRRHMARHWVALLVYVAGSLAVLAAGRVAFGGPIVALETRYLADAAIPLVVAVGAALMPLRGEQAAWLPVAARLGSLVPPASRLAAATSVGVVVVGLSLHAVNAYAGFSAANPYRPFVDNVRTSLAALPDSAEVYDTALPVDIVGPIFQDYNSVSRFIAPMVDDKTRRETYGRTSYTRPYFLDASGHFQRMAVLGAESLQTPPGSCGWNVVNGATVVPLGSSAFAWRWAVRVGYLADRDTTARIVLGDAQQEVQLTKGLGEVFVTLVGAGDRVEVRGVDPGANVCIGDVQVGNPVPK